MDKFIFHETRTESMLIRQYRKGDEPGIVSVHNSAFRKKIDTLPDVYQYKDVFSDDILSWLEEGASLWVVESDEQILGYARVRLEVEHGKRDVPVLQFMPVRNWDMNESNLAVLPKYQRKGVAFSLINEIIKRHRSEVELVTAHTFSDNMAAEAIFSSLDFTMYDILYYPSFSEKYPLANSCVYASYELQNIEGIRIPTAEITFRKAEQKDAETLLILHKHNVFWCEECLTLEWNREFIAGTYGHEVFVAEHEGKVIGAIDYFKDGRIGITGLLPEYRSRGFGSAMLLDILKEMKQAGYKRAFIDSGLTQTDAIKMYERFGFTIERRQNCWVKILK